MALHPMAMRIAETCMLLLSLAGGVSVYVCKCVVLLLAVCVRGCVVGCVCVGWSDNTIGLLLSLPLHAHKPTYTRPSATPCLDARTHSLPSSASKHTHNSHSSIRACCCISLPVAHSTHAHPTHQTQHIARTSRACCCVCVGSGEVQGQLV